MKFPIRFYCALGVSAALLAFLPRFVSFLPKFRNVAETPSSGMGVLEKVFLFANCRYFANENTVSHSLYLHSLIALTMMHILYERQ